MCQTNCKCSSLPTNGWLRRYYGIFDKLILSSLWTRDDNVFNTLQTNRNHDSLSLWFSYIFLWVVPFILRHVFNNFIFIFASEMLNIFCHLKSYQKRLVVERKTVMQLNIWQQIGFFIFWVFVSTDVGMVWLWSEKNSIVFESVFGLQLILNHFWTVTPFIINVLLFGVSMLSAVRLTGWRRHTSRYGRKSMVNVVVTELSIFTFDLSTMRQVNSIFGHWIFLAHCNTIQTSVPD